MNGCNKWYASGFFPIKILLGTSILNHLRQPQPLLDPEFEMSPNVTPDLVAILLAHNQLTNVYGHLIGFRVFRAEKVFRKNARAVFETLWAFFNTILLMFCPHSPAIFSAR